MAVTKSLVFITCLCFARDFVFCDDYEEIGKDITLTPSIRGKPTEILWKHNDNKVLLYDGREMVVHDLFTRRVVVDFETGQLTIRKLTSRDSGRYQSEIVINGKVQTSSHTVTVLDVLPEPKVTCEPDETSNVKKLLCSVDSRTQPSYEWSGLDIKVHSGPELLVEEQEEHSDSVYTCTVKNHANSKSTDFTLRDCHTGRAGTAVIVPVVIVLILVLLIILLVLLGIFLYRRKEKSRQSDSKKRDLESGEGLFGNNQKDVMPGSSEATLPSHARLPTQNQTIMDKKWHQDNGAESSGETDEEQQLLKEHNLKQSPRSAVSEANQEDTGNEGEGDKNVKNSKHADEAEENTDETEMERLKQRQEEEEKEKSQKPESRNEEKCAEHQNERDEQKTEDNCEDDQTPGEKDETKHTSDTETVSPQSAVTERNNMDTENEGQRHKDESQSDEGEQSAEQKNESMRNQKSKDDMRPGEKEEEKQNTAEAGDPPAVDQPLDAQALNSPAVTDSPANLEKKPINSSDSSLTQSDQDQEEEEERKRPGQEQMAEGKNPDPETQTCKKTDPDSAINSVSQREETQTKNLNQSPQSAESEANQEDTGNEGERDKNEKNSKHADEAKENTDETEMERLKQRQEEEAKEKSQKPESRNEEKCPEHQNERDEQKTEDNREDGQTPGEKDETKHTPDTETVSPQSAVPERNNMDRENEAEQRHRHEKKSQSDEGEQSAEQKNESMRNQKSKDGMRPGEKEEEKQDTAEAGDHPAVDQPLGAEALSSPAVTDSPANLEKKPINSSDSSSTQTD